MFIAKHSFRNILAIFWYKDIADPRKYRKIFTITEWRNRYIADCWIGKDAERDEMLLITIRFDHTIFAVCLLS